MHYHSLLSLSEQQSLPHDVVCKERLIFSSKYSICCCVHFIQGETEALTGKGISLGHFSAKVQRWDSNLSRPEFRTQDPSSAL